jgi:hypothetical protein
VNQQVEYLRLHRNEFAVAAQLAKVGVQRAIAEVKFHVRCRIFSQETIKSISWRDQASGKVLSSRFSHSAKTEIEIPLPSTELI